MYRARMRGRLERVLKLFINIAIHVLQELCGKLRLLEKNLPIGRVGGVILSVVIADGDLVEIQPVQILPIIIVQRAIAAVGGDVALQKLRIDLAVRSRACRRRRSA